MEGNNNNSVNHDDDHEGEEMIEKKCALSEQLHNYRQA